MHSAALRRELSVRGQQIAATTGSVHELTPGETPSVIFGREENRRHGNFHPASYRNICANPQWARRLRKVHTSLAHAVARRQSRSRRCAGNSAAQITAPMRC